MAVRKVLVAAALPARPAVPQAWADLGEEATSAAVRKVLLEAVVRAAASRLVALAEAEALVAAGQFKHLQG